MSIKVNEIEQYVESHISEFHQSRLKSIEKLKLINILRRKNPYLFRAKNINTADELVKLLLQAHLSSQEETLFGEFLEKLAIFACKEVKGGMKSGITGIDLEFEKSSIRYIISIKSGPNWGNSSQIRKMCEDFTKAQKVLRTQNPGQQVIAVNGCCYGKDEKPDKGTYFKYCGQKFWEFITDDPEFYIKIIEPLGYKAKEKNDLFYEEYSKLVNRLNLEFLQHYCNEDGCINWPLLVKINSGFGSSVR